MVAVEGLEGNGDPPSVAADSKPLDEKGGKR
jgi:hypothetical protein